MRQRQFLPMPCALKALVHIEAAMKVQHCVERIFAHLLHHVRIDETHDGHGARQRRIVEQVVETHA